MHKNYQLFSLVVLGLVAALAAPVAADSEEVTPSIQEGEEEPASTSAEEFERRPASRRFVALGSNAFLHGYVTGVFSDFGKDFPNPDNTPPGQLLVSPTSNSSFAYDWALFVGTDVSEQVRLITEVHYVSDPSGDFKPVIAATEANITWMPFGPNSLRVSMGLFWTPFGIVMDDWFSAENLFALIPEATKAFPQHYNERGIKVEGQYALEGDWGLNYALSLGNGVRGMAIGDQKSFDFDNNKAVVGRIGVFPGVPGLELGFSAMDGTLRDREDPERPLDQAQRYAANFSAWGLDVSYQAWRWDLRGYWISSKEKLSGVTDLEREGWMVEAALIAWEGEGLVTSIEPKIRLDHSRQDVLFGSESETEVLALGADFWLVGPVILRVEYFFHDEQGLSDLDRDGIAVRLSAIF